MKTTVLFDTNAYRLLTLNKNSEQSIALIKEIKEKEATLGIHASAITITGMEMVANLNENQQGPNHTNCLNGLIALAHHCYDEASDNFQVAPPPYANFAKAAFGRYDPAYEQEVRNMAGLFSDFRKDPDNALAHHGTKGTLDKFATYFAEGESGFIEKLDELIKGCVIYIDEKYPNAIPQQRRKKLLAYIKEEIPRLMVFAIIKLVSGLLGVSLTEKQLDEMTGHILTVYPISGAFYSHIMNHVIIGNIDLFSEKSKQKHWNWTWDYHVCSFISEDTIRQRNVLLVTGDKAILKVLEDNGLGEKVMTLPQYLEHIGVTAS